MKFSERSDRMTASNDDDRRKIPKLNVDNVDRISNIPIEIVSYILSRLSTEEAVGTSILSHRWRYLWTSITNFDFKGLPKFSTSQAIMFAYFVDRVFCLCTSSYIRKFHLNASWDDKTNVVRWINEAVKRNPKEIDINVYYLPLSIFSCKTLSILKLSIKRWNNRKIVSVDLPCLKVLHMKRVDFSKDIFLEKLFHGCPILQHLSLTGYSRKDTKFGSFNLPYLTFLHIKCQDGWEGDIIEKLIHGCPALEDLSLAVYLEGVTNNCLFDLPCVKVLRIKWKDCCKSFVEKLILGCPALENLTLGGSPQIGNFMVSSPALKTLRIKGPKYYYGRNIVTLSVKAPNLECLHFDSKFINVDVPEPYALPKFHNLTSLKVITPDYRFWERLFQLISSSPFLEILSLYHQAGDSSPKYAWVKPELVPKCFGSHLAVIKLKGLKGRTTELQLIRYFLKNAKVLRRMSIDFRDLTEVERRQFIGQLEGIPSVSKFCEILIHGDKVTNL